MTTPRPWIGVPGQQLLRADGVCGVYFRVVVGPVVDLPVLCARDRPCSDHDDPACPRCGQAMVGTVDCAYCLENTPQPDSLPLHRTEAGWPRCSTCDGGGCPDCTDPA